MIEAIWTSYIASAQAADKANKEVIAAMGARSARASKLAAARRAYAQASYSLNGCIVALQNAYNGDLAAIKAEMQVRCPSLIS